MPDTSPAIAALMRLALNTTTETLNEAYLAWGDVYGDLCYREQQYFVMADYGDIDSDYRYRVRESYYDYPVAVGEKFVLNRINDVFMAYARRITGNSIHGCCNGCSRLVAESDGYSSRYGWVCHNCIDEFTECADCNIHDYTYHLTNIDGRLTCQQCLRKNYQFCNHCEEWFPKDEHDVANCVCHSPILNFTFPAGDVTITNDQRITLELPKGEISDTGIEEIAWALEGYLRDAILAVHPTSHPFYHLRDKFLPNVGNQWQTKKGNFTRRLSSAVYKEFGYKIDPKLLSHVGNLAQRHTAAESTWNIELTRELNGEASEYANGSSCWWGGSMSKSRCALKSWGGMGIRSYNEGVDRRFPSGRAWIQPLNEDLIPTHNAEGAHAYVVYNGYGTLNGYNPARLIAMMTGKTYKKITFTASPQYVNGSSGYLVSDEETCKRTSEICLGADQPHYHHQFDVDEVSANMKIAA